MHSLTTHARVSLEIGSHLSVHVCVPSGEQEWVVAFGHLLGLETRGHPGILLRGTARVVVRDGVALEV